MIFPVALLFVATLAAAVMAYGTHANWAQFEHGYAFILLARRLQWPLAAASLALCLAVLGLVVAGRRRAWWLIGLAPVLALFVHRFASDPANRFLVVEDPPFVPAAEAGFVGDDDEVVGLRLGDQDYAYPYAALFDAPVVIHAEHDERLAVMWSAYANRVLAVRVGRELRGADLDVVSMPANALLLYNRAIGQFVNGLTGLTPQGGKPEGFGEVVPAAKSSWRAWRERHPETKVLAPLGRGYAAAPRGALRPIYPLPQRLGTGTASGDVILVGAERPVAFPRHLLRTGPLNLTADGVPVLVFRHPAGGTATAFRRQVQDLRPRFRANPDPRRRPKAAFVDEDTGTGWDPGGVAVDGPKEFRGRRLAPVPVDDDVPYAVAKFWYPDLVIAAEE